MKNLSTQPKAHKLISSLSIGAFWILIITLFSTDLAHAHHPLEGTSPESFTFIDGLISGLAHPILGIDHFLFLFSIGLVGFSFRRWVPILLIFGLLGTISSLIYPLILTNVELIICLSLFVSSLIAIGLINPIVLLPLITCHGYALSQSVVGAELTPISAYIIGLLISESAIIYIGIIFLRRFVQYRNIFSAVLAGIGISFSFGAILG